MAFFYAFSLARDVGWGVVAIVTRRGTVALWVDLVFLFDTLSLVRNLGFAGGPSKVAFPTKRGVGLSRFLLARLLVVVVACGFPVRAIGGPSLTLALRGRSLWGGG